MTEPYRAKPCHTLNCDCENKESFNGCVYNAEDVERERAETQEHLQQYDKTLDAAMQALDKSEKKLADAEKQSYDAGILDCMAYFDQPYDDDDAPSTEFDDKNPVVQDFKRMADDYLKAEARVRQLEAEKKKILVDFAGLNKSKKGGLKWAK